MYDDSLSPQPGASRPPQWGSNLVIYECTARCEQDNPVIQAGVITVAGGPWRDVDWRLVLDDNDVAYIVNGPYPWRSGSNVEEVLLGRCEDNCTQQNAWDFRLLLNTAPPSAIGAGLDITIDPRTQQPVVGFYSNDPNDPQQPNGPELVQRATCTANCNEDDFFERVFTLETIYDTDSLAPPPPPQTQCVSLGWGGTNPVSVAASGTGISLISNPSHFYACGASAGDFIDPITGELEEGFTGNTYTAFVPLASVDGVGIFPTSGQVITTAEDYSPRIRWEVIDGATWYHVYVATSDYETFVFSQWYQASEVCGVELCMSLDDIWLPQAGQYYLWMGHWSESIGDAYVETYVQTPFQINLRIPTSSVSGATPSGIITTNEITLQWQAEPNTLWYQIWVGLADYSNTDGNLFGWYRADEICAEGTCTLLVPGMLANAEYTWWMQSWGPGGFPDWYRVSDFTVAP